MFESNVIVSLIEATGTLALVSLFYGAIARSGVSPITKSLYVGALFSSAALFAMYTPVEFAPGVIFDGRAILVGLGAAFGGFPAMILLTVIVGGARLLIGGAGAISGTTGILLSAVLGYVWMQAYARSDFPKVVKLAAGGVIISLEFIAIFLLPYELAIKLFTTLYPIILISFVSITILLGYLIEREHAFIEIVQNLKTAANTDQLTGLLNRRGFEETVMYLTRSHDVCSVVVFDLDHFKSVNDKFGHIGGDKALVAFANTLRKYCRPEDIVVRLGGEEFAIYMPNLKYQEAEMLTLAILDQIRSTCVKVGKSSITITASAGVAEYSPIDTEFWQAIRWADQALYQAKQLGRDQVVTLAA